MDEVFNPQNLGAIPSSNEILETFAQILNTYTFAMNYDWHCEDATSSGSLHCYDLGRFPSKTRHQW